MIQQQKTVYFLGGTYEVLNPNPTTDLVATNYSNARHLLGYRGLIERLVLDPNEVNAKNLAHDLRRKDINPINAYIPIWLIASTLPSDYEGMSGIELMSVEDISISGIAKVVLKESLSQSR